MDCDHRATEETRFPSTEAYFSDRDMQSVYRGGNRLITASLQQQHPPPPKTKQTKAKSKVFLKIILIKN